MPAPIEVAPIRRPAYFNKQELNLDFYEEFQPAAYYPGNDSEDKDNFYPRELEVAFCRNFSCCGLLLSDLHVLLQHYEEYHVRFEEDDSQASFYDDDWSSNDGSAPNSPQLPTKQIHNQQYTINAMLKKKVMPSRSDLYPEEIGISHNDSSAFDTSILRSSQSQNVKSSKKRNHSQFTATTLDMMTPNAKKMALPAHMGMTTSTFPDLTMSAMSDEEFMAQTGAMFMPSSNNASSLAADKPYKCPVPGCDKAYKNPNGLKYHNQHGHCNTQSTVEGDKPSMKPYQCTIGDCGKRYKNLNGLKYHIEHAHMAALSGALGLTSPLPTPMTTPVGSPIQTPLPTPTL